MNKYEQLIEHIINDETDKARELFHTIVVEKSRDIYESLIDEQDLDEVGGNQVEELVDEITIDEQGMTEEEEGEEDAMDAEEMPSEEGHEEAEIEDRVVDLEDALDELKAEFDALMAGEEHEEHAEPGIHGDEGHEMGGEEEQSEFFESEEDDEEDKDDEEKEVVKEYVDRVADTGQKNPSGKMAATGKDTPQQGETNPKSPVAGKNDMGGSSANIARGNSNPAPDGTSPKATAKPKGELIGKVLNTPGADAGKAFAKKETAVKAEVGGVNKTTPVAK
jgi:hypothetical protein